MLAPHVLRQVGVEDPCAFFDYLCRENGYRNVCITADGGIVCTVSLAYTDAILSELSACGYADRWCYHKMHNHGMAAAFLHLWLCEGTEEPDGWHRHPDTGRRMDEHGNRYINP